MTDGWGARIAAVWADDSLTGDQVIARIDALAAERPSGDARALFERAGARDSAGLEAEAEPLYRAALAAGLDEEHRPQAVIQLASTIRNLDRSEEALEMLRAEYERDPGTPMNDAAAAFYALALASAGRDREGLAIVLQAIAPHLPRYSRSITSYAQELADGTR